MKVFVVLHSSVEAGSSDTFESVAVFSTKKKANEFCDSKVKEINFAENEECGIEEQYWVEEQICQ